MSSTNPASRRRHTATPALDHRRWDPPYWGCGCTLGCTPLRERQPVPERQERGCAPVGRRGSNPAVARVVADPRLDACWGTGRLQGGCRGATATRRSGGAGGCVAFWSTGLKPSSGAACSDLALDACRASEAVAGRLQGCNRYQAIRGAGGCLALWSMGPKPSSGAGCSRSWDLMLAGDGAVAGWLQVAGVQPGCNLRKTCPRRVVPRAVGWLPQSAVTLLRPSPFEGSL